MAPYTALSVELYNFESVYIISCHYTPVYEYKSTRQMSSKVFIKYDIFQLRFSLKQYERDNQSLYFQISRRITFEKIKIELLG